MRLAPRQLRVRLQRSTEDRRVPQTEAVVGGGLERSSYRRSGNYYFKKVNVLYEKRVLFTKTPVNLIIIQQNINPMLRFKKYATLEGLFL